MAAPSLPAGAAIALEFDTDGSRTAISRIYRDDERDVAVCATCTQTRDGWIVDDAHDGPSVQLHVGDEIVSLSANAARLLAVAIMDAAAQVTEWSEL